MASASSIFRRGASQDEAILVTGPGCDSRRSSLADDECEGNTAATGKTSTTATTTAVRVTQGRCEPVRIEGETKKLQQQQRNPILQFLDAVMKPSSQDETELQEMEDRKNTVNILSPSPNQREVVGGYDVCREYSYSTDEDDQVSGTGRNEKNHKKRGVNKLFQHDQAHHSYLIHSDSFEEETPEDAVLPIHVLGKTYHPINDYAFRRDDESSLFWFTYRADFPEIKPYGIHSDAGWGCMLRSAQMMLAQVLRMHFRSRDWRSSPSLARRRQDPFLRSLLTWFADFPSKSDCVYSLHNMVASGLNYDKLPGEWYGPGTACYVLRDLVELHDRQMNSVQKQQQRRQQQQQQQQLGDDNRKLFRVHVASQGTVYRDEIRRLMTRTSQARFDKEKRKKEAQGSPAAHPLDMAWEEELIESVGEIEWDTSLLLLIPLRLGLKSFNAQYVQTVAHTFSLPQSVGLLGGRPRGARWFYGAVADGSKIFGLDPHTVQNSPNRRMARVNGKDSSVVDLSDEYLRSVHTSYIEVFSLQRMDPSIALGFYCRNEQELENLLTSTQNWKKEHPDDPELFSVADTSPDYASSLSSAMKDMMLSGTVASLVDEDVGDDLSEEDEYVML